MPTAPRQNTKATKIAYKILGKPANQDFKRPKSLKKVHKRLVFEETQLVR